MDGEAPVTETMETELMSESLSFHHSGRDTPDDAADVEVSPRTHNLCIQSGQKRLSRLRSRK